MKRIAVIQARMESTRLPGKVLMNICGNPVLKHIVDRTRKSKYIDEVVIATSTNLVDDGIVRFAIENNIKYFRGSHENVLERVYKCVAEYTADIIIRLTGDNALIDPTIIDDGIEYFTKKEDMDYIYYREGLPLGVAVEIFKFEALQQTYNEAADSECLEHVTPYIYRNPNKFKSEIVNKTGADYSALRWTLDTESDFKLVSEIYNTVYLDNKNFSFNDILEEYKNHPKWKYINQDIKQVNVTYKGESH